MNRKKPDIRMSEYTNSIIPKGAVIDFIFYEDFDHNGVKEAVVGITEFLPFPPESSVFCIEETDSGYKHKEILSTDNPFYSRDYGVIDNAFATDTDGDGCYELVLSLAQGNGQTITIFIFDWDDKGQVLSWKSEESFFHGSLEVSDVDGDGISEVVVENAIHKGLEIIGNQEACYHVRESSFFKKRAVCTLKIHMKLKCRI